MIRYYLAGPMSGIPFFNYPAFNAAAERLRNIGLVIENPAENNAPACGSWHGYMKVAIRQMMTCDAIVVLPGWENSPGATEEVRLAGLVGMTIYPLKHFEKEV